MPIDRDPLVPSHPSALTRRLTALLAQPEAICPLDQACTLVAAHFQVGPDPDGTDGQAVREGLDELAGGVAEATFAGVVDHLSRLGWGGDRSDYALAASSLLPEVVRRRRGLPISLAVVTVEVARRVGVEAAVVGMPGHVLVAGAGGGPLADPFHRRPSLSTAAAQALFAQLHGPGARWDPAFLAPIGARSVLSRILANLANRYREDNQHRREAVALGLRSLVPGSGLVEKGALASALARSGAFDRAATCMEEVADAGGGGADPHALRNRAQRWRARLN